MHALLKARTNGARTRGWTLLRRCSGGARTTVTTAKGAVMSELNKALAIVGFLVLFLGLFSRVLKRWGLPEPLLVLLVGIALGPHGTGTLLPSTWGDEMQLLEQAARITLAIGLMGVALRIPPEFTRKEWRATAIVLILAMPFMTLTGGVLVHLVVGLPLLAAMLVGAIVAPTDPVVASSIVTGDLATEKLPEGLRHLLSSESGWNDGLAYLFVLLPVLLLTRATDEALTHWLGRVLFWEIGTALVLGGVIGYVAGRLLRWSEERKLIEDPSLDVYTIALALFTVAMLRLIGSDGILAVFVAGLAFDHVVGAGERIEEERVVEGMDRFFTLPTFLLFGLILPWREWAALGWRGFVLVVAVLLLRRLPLVLLLKGRVRLLPHARDVLFLGWFGPLGVAALFYVSLSLKRTGLHDVWTVTSLLVFASLFVHGVTAMPFTRGYGARSRNSSEAVEPSS